eukprot:gene746-334_t
MKYLILVCTITASLAHATTSTSIQLCVRDESMKPSTSFLQLIHDKTIDHNTHLTNESSFVQGGDECDCLCNCNDPKKHMCTWKSDKCWCIVFVLFCIAVGVAVYYPSSDDDNGGGGGDDTNTTLADPNNMPLPPTGPGNLRLG